MMCSNLNIPHPLDPEDASSHASELRPAASPGHQETRDLGQPVRYAGFSIPDVAKSHAYII